MYDPNLPAPLMHDDEFNNEVCMVCGAWEPCEHDELTFEDKMLILECRWEDKNAED